MSDLLQSIRIFLDLLISKIFLKFTGYLLDHKKMKIGTQPEVIQSRGREFNMRCKKRKVLYSYILKKHAHHDYSLIL